MNGRPDNAALMVRDLVKRYPKRDKNAVDGLSFEVRPGEIFGLLGPNGAGKSTTLGILTTRIKPTSGDVYLVGHDVRREPVAARALLAVVPQYNNLDRSLTPRRNLLFHAAYHGVDRAERKARATRLLEEFDLIDRADDHVNMYSGGMAQRLMIARALMHNPRVLFLDEPTTGLDPQIRLYVWDRVRGLRDRGVTVVLTTHNMEEAAALCDRVGIMDHGKLLALDSPAALTRMVTERSVLELTVVSTGGTPAESLLDPLLALDGVAHGEHVDGATDTARFRLHLTAEPASLLGPVVAELASRSATLSDVHIRQSSLEDVFIQLTGRGLR
jgi:ABC-2 type transport system ATP-binding protein